MQRSRPDPVEERASHEIIASMARHELPTGTVTFLFTDVEGSTRLLQKHGAGYADLLAEHRTALRGAFIRYDGVEVDTQGDAFFVAFARATDAVAAAAAAREALTGSPIRVRIGIHTGEPQLTDEGYVGIDVHRAARIAAAAHGGQIVLSATTRRLLQSDAHVRDLGEHRLKDLVSPERLFQLGDGDFPPLRTLDATNLPIVSIPLVGRERELEELVALFANGTRLLTVTGPGGTGKTRLALQVAAELVGTLHDGVFWIPLAGLSDPDLVPSEIARTVGAPDDLAGFLRGRELLVLLDNFEHLLDAAPVVSTLLASSSGVRVLVTSRTPLRVSAEQEYRLEPLPDGDAATLFVQRARGVGRQLTADATVAEICRRLDGLPLAIELAAARTKLLSPARLLERLGSVLPLLTGGTRDAPERQRTLRATIEWSYDLLDPAVQALFARLAVFAGAFPLAAAEEVAGADLDGLEALVDSSLMKPIGEDRFLMLETIREYAAEKLAASRDADEVRRRHAAFFAELAENAYEQRFETEAEWSERLEVDHDDLRLALDWLVAHHPDQALALAGALGWFWLSHGHLAEGRDRLARAIAEVADESAHGARALVAAGALTARCGEADAGRSLAERGIDVWNVLGNQQGLASALDTLGWLLFYDAGDDRASLQAFERSLELHRDLGDAGGETRALVGVCQLLVAQREVARAGALSLELLERSAGALRTDHFAYHFLADCGLIRGDTAEAETRYRQSLQAALALGDVIETSIEVQGLAMAVAGNGDPARALRLAGAVAALWESLGVSFSFPFWDALLERYLGAARAELGQEARAAWAQGRGLAFDDAVELALKLE
jgi:predicted ATPase/class 3 adenylate cyclase